MVLKILHKILSVSIAFIVLFSTFSFTVEKHYCGGELIDVAIFSDVKKCDTEMPSSTKEAIKKPCCKDEIKLVKGQDKLKLDTVDKVNFNKVLIAHKPEYKYLNFYESLPKQTVRFKDYSPPKLVYDIHILDQVFRN